MTDLDRTLTRLLGEELTREGDVIPPPLAELRSRATTHRRRRWGAVAAGTAAAAAVATATVQLWPGGAGDLSLPGEDTGPALPAGAEGFTVPTYDWEGNAQATSMDALVSGSLGFTPEGCTLLYLPDQPESVRPVVFPDAVGVRYANGVRAVVHETSGRVYAVEGRPFEYSGGWVPAGETWTGQCGQWSAEVARINDDPDGEPLTDDPEPPAQPAPTRVATEEEMGWYDVPTFAWDPAQGGDSAQVAGTVQMTEDGCPVIESENGRTYGLVLPNAQGRRLADGRPAVYSTFPDGSGGLMAEEGMSVSYAGGYLDEGDPADDHGWSRLCPGSAVDGLALVYDNGLP